jgi:hypothetical protein
MVPVQIAVLALLTIPPWLLGGVRADTQFWLFTAVLCATIACWSLCLTRPVSARPLPLVLIPLGLAIGLAAFQTFPLSKEVHRAVSPKTLRWWQDLTPATTMDRQTVDTSRYPVSLYPASTQRELNMLTLAVAAFLLSAIVLKDRVAFAVAGVAVAINGTALAFFGLVQQLTWNGQLYWSIPLTGGGVPFASYVNRNNAAGFLNMCLACAIGLTVWGLVHTTYTTRRRTAMVERNSCRSDRPNSPLQRVLHAARVSLVAVLLPLARLNFATAVGLVAAGCIAAGIFCSLSRGAMVAMAGAAIITLLAAALAGHWRRGWLGPMILTGLLGCLLVGYVGRGDTCAPADGDDFG